LVWTNSNIEDSAKSPLNEPCHK